MSSLILFGLLCAAIIIALVVWLIIIIKKEDDEIRDDIIFENYLPQYANGYSMGIVKKFIKGKRIGVLFEPRDIDRIKFLKEKKKVENQLVFFEKRQLIFYPKGSLSDERNRLCGLPPNPEDLPEEIKKTTVGKAFMEVIKNANATEEETGILRKRIGLQKELLEKTEGLDIVKDFLEMSEEAKKDFVHQFKHRDDKKTSTYPTNTDSGYS